MKRANAIALAGVAVGLVAAATWALQPRPVTVETALVTRGPYEQLVSDDGKTRVRDRYVVSAPLAGRVERIRLRAGDPVAVGMEVATLTPAMPAFQDARTTRELQERLGAAEAQQQRAVAELRRTEALRDQARLDLERQRRLAQEGFVAPTVREQAELQLRTAERAVDSARFAEEAAAHELAQARAALALYRGGAGGGRGIKVVSPVKGSVLRVSQESEGVVPLGAPLVEVADARSLEAVVDVLTQESVAIRPGMAARLEVGNGVAALRARVRLIEPAAFTKVSALGVEEQRVNVVLDFIDPLDALAVVGDGFRVEAHIVVHRVEDATRVPVGALFRREEGWSVFVAEGGRAVRRRVEVPMRNGELALVTSGLRPGDRVVVYPSDALDDGMKLDIRGALAGGR